MKARLTVLKTILAGGAIMTAAVICPSTIRAENGAPATQNIVQTGTPPGAPPMAYGVSEVTKMYNGKVSPDVITGFIQSSTLPFHLTADNIIYLRGIGMPNQIITTLLQRDGQLQQQAAANYQQQQVAGAPGVVPPTPNAVVVGPSTPPPSIDATVVGQAYPDYGYDYGYAYPYYGYPYYASGPYWGWGGWGWGGHWRGYGHAGWGGGFHGGFAGGHGFAGGAHGFAHAGGGGHGGHR